MLPKRIPLVKRLFDLLVTLPLIILASPFMLVIGLFILVKDGRPILFNQPRPGLNGAIFVLHKFRTMREAVDRRGNPLPDAQRLSGWGKLLRATSLDELPELVNILMGEMSLVGPRPLLVDYLERYSPEQMRRHEVLPGMTGWAQVNGRNALTWEEKFTLDVWYVDHWSFWLDIKILFQTVGVVLRQVGISHPGEATMGEFKGNKD